MEKKTVLKILFIAAVVGGGIWAWKKFVPKKSAAKGGGGIGFKRTPFTAQRAPDGLRKLATVGGEG